MCIYSILKIIFPCFHVEYEEVNNDVYELVDVKDKNNIDDISRIGRIGKVNYDYSIGKYNVTIEQYCAFLNAVASVEDKYNLYDVNMGIDLNICGITRSGKLGSYSYTIMNNLGDSSQRPITYVSCYNIFRFSNWMTNGQPSGEQNDSTTENGSYKLIVDPITKETSVEKLYDTSKDMYYMPTENEWYKAAYYSPNYKNTGLPGYYLYATQSDDKPSNFLSESKTSRNAANYVDGVNYCVTQQAFFDVKQNYLTAVGTFARSRSYYGTFDQTGLVYNLLESNISESEFITRGGFWAGGSVSMTKNTSAIIRENTSAESDGFRLVMYKKIES
jgi:formylglycine-generating enzyme required for sulfatase activity